MNEDGRYIPPPPETFLKRRHEDSDYTPEKEPPRDAREISQSTARIILDMVEKKKTLKTIRSKYPWYHPRQLERLKKISTPAVSPNQRYAQIDQLVYDRVVATRRLNHVLKGWMIRLWGAEAAREVEASNFKASESWLLNFKKRRGIVSRKKTEFRSRSQDELEGALKERAIELAERFSRRRLHFRDRLILNFDQSGFQWEMTTGRTLSWKGERDTVAHVNQTNRATHSYTIQPLVSRDGRTLGKLLLCIQGSQGSEFGPRVQESVDRLMREYGNIHVVPSSSGKMNNKLMAEWVKEVLIPAVGDDIAREDELDDHGTCSVGREPRVLLLGDSWGGNTNKDLQQSLESQVVRAVVSYDRSY